MKFKELKNTDKFTTLDNDRVFIKVPRRKATCCTPEYNAVSRSGKKVLKFINDQTEVKKL